ncbi:multiubiquitin domain-containing protein [Devosia submarina]|uniref:multiubiquitin domain-containing protein n=1 Tax=Devosia submarina TaxID=1173082 RepID=UPI00130057A6|nr:multiubiquitin domain-containing protein [Devosia submarina]
MSDVNTNRTIEIAGTDLVFRAVPMTDRTPSGDQIALAAGFASDDHAYVLQFLNDGELEDVRHRESVPLSEGHRFLVALGDRSYRVAFAGDAIDWPARFITAATLRKLKNVAADKSIYLEKTDEADIPLDEEMLIDLDEAGVESFKPGKLAGPKKQTVRVKHLGELETARLKVEASITLATLWEQAYRELEVTRTERDVLQADTAAGPVSLMDHLSLTLEAAQQQGLCDKKFEIAARTGGA